jgi:nicotinamidase-related amidase
MQKEGVQILTTETVFDNKIRFPVVPDSPDIKLFIIDPQVDFHPGGSLAVPGADEDSKRIADMIKKNKHNIHDIFVSLDSHHPSHIAHAVFWVDKKGNKPAPFTTITYKDVVDRVWLPRDDSAEILKWCKKYTKALERKGRMTLTIWPDHCIIGTKGHAIEAIINEALQEWASYSKRPVTYVMKGQNCRTEMYSALEAEVEDPLDSSTALNIDLVSMLQVSGRVISFRNQINGSVETHST